MRGHGRMRWWPGMSRKSARATRSSFRPLPTASETTAPRPSVYVSAASPPSPWRSVWRRAVARRRRLRRRLIRTFDSRALTGSASLVPPATWSRSADSSWWYAAAAVAIAPIGARYLTQESDLPALPADPAGGEGGAGQGWRSGVRARHRGGAAPGRIPGSVVGAAGRGDSPRGRRDGAADPQGVNLAAKVADGQQVNGPARGGRQARRPREATVRPPVPWLVRSA